ncbi:MAG TPA: Hpt domain-containing protein, partial [Burkholderiaceae bacterium]|nr:Hpt domain-containing protein [Burkholderiaceae bacterium]
MESLQLPTAAFDRAAVVFVDAMTAALAAEAAPFTGAQPAVCNDVVAAQRLLRRCRTLLADLLREAKAAPSLGFWHAASWLDANLDLALTQSRPLREGELRVLGQWPQAVARCCEAPGAAAVVALLSLVDDTCWLLRPSATSREGMRVALAGYRRPAAAPATPVEEAATDREECSLLVGHAAAGHAAAAHAAATHSAVDHAAVDHAAVDHAFFPLETLVGFEVEVAVDAGDDGGPASAAEAGPPPGLSMPCAVEPESPARNDQIGRPPALLGDDEVETFSAAFEALASTAAGGVRRASDRRLYRQALQGVVGLAQLHARTDLVEACARVAKNLDAMDAQPEVSETVPLLLLDFPVAALNYVGAPHDRESAEVLLGCLSDGAWPYPLEDSELFQMRALLRFEEPTQQPPALETWTPRDATVEVHTEGERSAPAIAARTPLPPVPTGLQQCDPEQLAVLATEFAAFATTLSSELEATDPSGAPAQRQRVLASCAELLGRFGGAAEAIGLTALQWVFAFVAAHVAAAQDRGLTQTQRRCLREWSRRVRAYLAAPTDPSAGAALAEWLTEEPWSSLGAAVDAHVVADLEGALIALDLVRSATVDTRPTQATAADVSLAIPADVNAELLDGLLSELPIQSAEFAAATQRLAAGGSLYDIEAAKRAAHTLKGAAHTVGVKGIANLTHHLEDILIGLTRHGALPPHALADVLSSAADCLEAMCEAVLGVSPPPGDAQQVLQQVLDWAVRVDREGAEAFEGAASAAPVPASATVASAAAAATSQAEAHAGPMLRVPAAVVDELLRLVGETMIANTQIREQLRLSAAHTQAVTRQSQALQQLTAELETLIDVRGAAAPLQALQTMRARSGAPADFDALEFEHFNELHTVSRRLIEAATDARELSGASAERLSALADLIETQARLHLENQGVVMKTRMVPVGSIVSRLQRSVRQTGRLLDKRVELHVHGLDTTIDSNVLSDLVDPLMHVLRNAIDHGIEAPPARVAAGKPVTGRIDLAFAREGSAIVVRCTDDGAGLDYARIRATAEAQGLLGTGQSVAEDELARLILRAGFSTR